MFLITEDGNTVQHLACMNKPLPGMMACLKAHGADFDVAENGMHDTPIYSARKAANLINYEKACKFTLNSLLVFRQKTLKGSCGGENFC